MAQAYALLVMELDVVIATTPGSVVDAEEKAGGMSTALHVVEPVVSSVLHVVELEASPIRVVTAAAQAQ